MRVVIVARQFGHSWSASAHEAQARKWLHGPKRTVRGASASMQIVQRRRSSSASFSRLGHRRDLARGLLGFELLDQGAEFISLDRVEYLAKVQQ